MPAEPLRCVDSRQQRGLAGAALWPSWDAEQGIRRQEHSALRLHQHTLRRLRGYGEPPAKQLPQMRQMGGRERIASRVRLSDPHTIEEQEQRTSWG